MIARSADLVLAGAIVAGRLLDVLDVNPIRMLFLSADHQRPAGPPLLVLVMLVGNNRTIMGKHVNTPTLNVLGWTATAVMTLAALAMLVTSLG